MNINKKNKMTNTNETKKTDYEEIEKIRKGLYNVAKTYLENKAEKHDRVAEISTMIQQEHESTKKSFFYKILHPGKDKIARTEIDRMERLHSLWASVDNLVEQIEVETKENLSQGKMDVLYTKIKTLEDEFGYTPQFKGKKHPDSTLYELQFQFPSFVKEKSKNLLETPSKEIKGFNTSYIFNDYFNCLFKHAKNHPEIAESVMKKMAEVYKLNRTPERITLANQLNYRPTKNCLIYPSKCISLERDLMGINELGESLGLTEEQVYEKYLS